MPARVRPTSVAQRPTLQTVPRCGGRDATLADVDARTPVTQRRRRSPSRFQRYADSGVLEAVFAALILLYSETFYGAPGVAPLTWPQFVVDSALCIAAGTSGRWPRGGGIATGVILMAMPLVHQGAPPAAVIAIVIPILAAGTRGLTRLRALLSVWYVAGASILSMPTASTSAGAVQTVLVWVILIGIAWAAGGTIHSLVQQSERLSQQRIEAVRSQRRSIARDLHDTVAYATSTMIMRAEQIKLRGVDDPALAEDLDFIISTGRRSIRDLRGMMETLRRNDPSLDSEYENSPWRIVSFAELLPQRIAELEAHGFQVNAQVDLAHQELPDSVREALGKLVVEATSNMVKHAPPPGPIRILIERHDDLVEAVFTNPLRPGRPAPREWDGFGLVGARERIEALGGELESTAASGTWLLRAQLPVGE